jgi:hypothetical protein
MSAAQLLAVVEVPHDDRVRCQAAGCNHSVFRRIHVVREDSVVRVYGSECFKKLFVGLPVASSTPRYTSPEGRRLTDDERRLLIENTERLVQQFESEYQAELARKAALVAVRSTPTQTTPAPPPPPQPPTVVSAAARQAAEAHAKQIVRSKYGVNPELPGWHGLVLMEMERLLRESEVP